jgi:hypothetical protein
MQRNHRDLAVEFLPLFDAETRNDTVNDTFAINDNDDEFDDFEDF